MIARILKALGLVILVVLGIAAMGWGNAFIAMVLLLALALVWPLLRLLFS